MEDEKKIQEQNDKTKNLWLIGTVGVAIYMLGYIAGDAKATEKITQSYNQGVMDTLASLVIRHNN